MVVCCWAYFFHFFVPFAVLLLCLLDPALQCDHLVGEEGAGPEVIKHFSCFSAEHEIFSANK